VSIINEIIDVIKKTARPVAFAGGGAVVGGAAGSTILTGIGAVLLGPVGAGVLFGVGCLGGAFCGAYGGHKLDKKLRKEINS